MRISDWSSDVCSSDLVPSKTELDAGRANYSRAMASVRSAEAQVLQARAQLATAQTNLDKARIYSPVNGVVLSRDIEPGQTVAASLNAPVLFTIAEDLSQMELEVSVDEADVGQVKDGQRATFTVDAFPGQTFPARIERVNVGSTTSDTSSSSSTSSSTSAGTVVAYTAVLSVSYTTALGPPAPSTRGRGKPTPPGSSGEMSGRTPATPVPLQAQLRPPQQERASPIPPSFPSITGT